MLNQRKIYVNVKQRRLSHDNRISIYEKYYKRIFAVMSQKEETKDNKYKYGSRQNAESLYNKQ